MIKHSRSSLAKPNIRNIAAVGIAAFLITAMGGTARAANPAAVVEDVGSDKVPVELFEFLEPGRTIALANDLTVTLGYLKSCRRETITGGKVVIGAEKSVVTGGKVSAETVECDGGKMNIPPEMASKSAVAVFRNVPSKRNEAETPQPQLTVYSLTPLISVPKQEKTVELRRLDASAPKLDVRVTNGLADLGKQNLALEPGGIYAIEFANSRLIVKIDPLSGQDGPVLSRLVRFAQ